MAQPKYKYIAVLERDERPGTSEPVLVSADPETVEAVIRLISARLERPSGTGRRGGRDHD